MEIRPYATGDEDAVTGAVRLRGVTESDLPAFFEQQCDADANRMAAFPARDWEAFLAHWAKILADPAVLVRTVLHDGRVAGNVVSWERAGRRLVGYWIGKDYWGRGVATAALAEFLRLNRVRPLYARVAKQNAGSIRVLQKCGFAVCEDDTPGPPGDGVEEFVFRLGTAGG